MSNLTNKLLSFAGAWKDTSLDNNAIWKKVANRHNRAMSKAFIGKKPHKPVKASS